MTCDDVQIVAASPRTSATAHDGAERRVALTGPEVGRRHLRRRRRQRRLERRAGLIALADRPRRSAVHDRLVALDDAVAQVALEVVVPGQAAPLGPRRLELARRPHRRPLVVRHDGEEALDADDAHAGKLRDRRLVDRDERGADAGGRITRPWSMPGTLKSWMY